MQGKADIARSDMLLLLKALTAEIRNTSCIQVILLYYLHSYSTPCVLQRGMYFWKTYLRIFTDYAKKLAKRISIPP